MATATATKIAKSLKACCPFCLASEIITIDLNDMSTINCGECDETFTARQAAAKMAEIAAKWLKIADWVDAAPID